MLLGFVDLQVTLNRIRRPKVIERMMKRPLGMFEGPDSEAFYTGEDYAGLFQASYCSLESVDNLSKSRGRKPACVFWQEIVLNCLRARTLETADCYLASQLQPGEF